MSRIAEINSIKYCYTCNNQGCLYTSPISKCMKTRMSIKQKNIFELNLAQVMHKLISKTACPRQIIT